MKYGVGSIDGYTIIAWLVVAGALVFLAYFLLWPFAVSTRARYPGLLFPRNSLRVETLREEKRVNGWQWLLTRLFQTRRSVLTYWSFVWVVPLGFLVVVSLAYLSPSILERVQPALVQHGWQAQLTITSLSFIVLIFLLERISRTEYREGVIQEFFASSRIMPIIYFTLSLSGLIAYLYFVQTPANVPPLVVNITFFAFLGTVVGIGYVYYRVARLIFFDPLDEIVIEQIQQGVDLQLREEERQSVARQVFEQRLPDFVERGVNRDGRLYTAQELGLDGYISDVNLGKLKKACQEFSGQFGGEDDPTLLLRLGLGREMQPGMDVLSIDGEPRNSVEIPDELATGVAAAIYCNRERPWQTGDQLVDRNLGRLGANTRNAVNNLNPTQLEKYLGYYIELLGYLAALNQSVTTNQDSTPAPVSDLVNHIYREFYPILEAAAQTGSSDLIGTVRGEIYRLSMAYHQQNETGLFEKSINLYASYYRVLSASSVVDSEQIHNLLSSLNNILTVLTGALGRIRTVEEGDSIASDIESFYEVLERIFQIAIEDGDDQTFNNIWDLGADEFVMVRSDGSIHRLKQKLEGIDDDEEQEQLKQELAVEKRQQEAVESFQNGFEETRFIAAAWAYREVRAGNLEQRVFQEMFSESIKGYSFATLAEVYLRICDSPRMDLFRWETEDADIFKGVRMSMPAVQTWVMEFFCAMGILLLDADQYEIDDLAESDNPMANIAIERQSYPDLTKTINSVTEDDLAKTGIAETELDDIKETKVVFVALHQQMEALLERREEDRVIDADVDPEKVSDFENTYISEFVDQFVLRTVFDDLGWLTVQQYDENLDIVPSGFRTFYPKEGFLPDLPVDVIHSLDRRARNHVDPLLQTWLDNEQDHLLREQIDAYDELPEELVQVCMDLENNGRTPQAILVSGFRATNILTDSDCFDGNYQPVEDAFGGFSFNENRIPVYEDPVGEFDALVLAGSNRPAELIEYQRANTPVFVDIKKVTRRFLEEQDPDGFPELTDEEIREKLQQVWVEIYYYAQFEASEDFGTILTIDTSTDTDTFHRKNPDATGGSAADGFRQLERWLKDHLHLGGRLNSESDQ